MENWSFLPPGRVRFSCNSLFRCTLIFFSLRVFWSGGRASRNREWGKDEPRAKVLIERVTRIFVGGGRAGRKVARVTLNAY